MKAPKDIVEALRVLGFVGRKMEYRMKMIILSIRKKIIKNNKRKRMGIPMLRKAAYRKAMKNRREMQDDRADGNRSRFRIVSVYPRRCHDRLCYISISERCEKDTVRERHVLRQKAEVFLFTIKKNIGGISNGEDVDSERNEVDRSGAGSKCWDLCYGKRLVLMGALDSSDGRLKKSRNHRTEKCVIMIPSIKMKQGAAVDERLTAPLTWRRTNGERIPTGSKWNTSSAV